MIQITRKDIASFLYNQIGMGCNCDLDNWQPEQSTGHSHVCRIHQSACIASPELIAKITEHKKAQP